MELFALCASLGSMGKEHDTTPAIQRLATQETHRVARHALEGPLAGITPPEVSGPPLALARMISERASPAAYTPRCDWIPEDSRPLDTTVLDRAPDEDDVAWFLWCAWLRLGLPQAGGIGVRSLEDLKCSYEPLGGPGGDEYFWGIREYFRWDERTRVYDSLLQRRTLELTVESQDELKTKMIALGHSFMQLAYREASKLLAKSIIDTRVTLKPGEITRLAEVGSKMELLARGQATDSISVRPDLSRLSDSELEAMRVIQNKIESGH